MLYVAVFISFASSNFVRLLYLVISIIHQVLAQFNHTDDFYAYTIYIYLSFFLTIPIFYNIIV